MQILVELPMGVAGHDKRCCPRLPFIMALEHFVIDIFAGSERRGLKTSRAASGAIHVRIVTGYGARHPRFLLGVFHQFPILADNRSDRSRSDDRQTD